MCKDEDGAQMVPALGLAAAVCLATWLLAWHIGGVVAWVLGSLLLAAGEQFLLLWVYALVRKDLSFDFQAKEVAMGAMAAVVGVWLRCASAPPLSLVVVPAASGIVNMLSHRQVREGYECVSLPANVLSTSVGEAAGYLLVGWLVPA